jgi:hypothetical protein
LGGHSYSKLSFSKRKTDIDSSRSWRLARGKPVRLQICMTSQELKSVLCGNILNSLKQNMQLKPEDVHSKYKTYSDKLCIFFKSLRRLILKNWQISYHNPW